MLKVTERGTGALHPATTRSRERSNPERFTHLVPSLPIDGFPIDLTIVDDVGLLVPVPDVHKELLVFLVVEVELRELKACRPAALGDLRWNRVQREEEYANDVDALVIGARDKDVAEGVSICLLALRRWSQTVMRFLTFQSSSNFDGS